MDVVHRRCAGIDISKRDAKVCVRIQGQGKRRTSATVTTWGAMTGQILALREHLLEQNVTCVVMEVVGPALVSRDQLRRLVTAVASSGDAEVVRFR